MSETPMPQLAAERRWPAVLAGKAPARQAAAFICVATVGGVAALVLLAALGALLEQTVLIPPLAASAALVFAAPALPLAQPRNVIGGQLTSAALFLPLLLLATLVIVGVGVAAGRTGKTARYPSYWW